MSVEENKAIARRFFEELPGSIDFLDEIVASDVVLDGDRGLDALKHTASEWATGFPDGKYVVEDMVAEGDKVAVRWSFTGTHTGEWFGLPPTNKQVTFGGTHTLRIADGKIVEQRGHQNFFGFYRQIGLIPPWDELIEQAKRKLG
jgi:predicted ester cyclase